LCLLCLFVARFIFEDNGLTIRTAPYYVPPVLAL
jgi:hypothetical protein